MRAPASRPAPRRPGADPVIEAYRSGIDETLLEENLRLTVEERLVKWMNLQRFAEGLRAAGRKAGL